MSIPARTIDRARALIEDDAIPFGPRTHPCVCRAGIHEHGGDVHSGGVKRTGCKRYRADLAWDLAYRALDAQQVSLGHAIRAADDLERQAHYKANPIVPGHWSIGASDTETCPRKIQYRNLPPDDMIYAPEDKREARMGTIIHDEVTRKMRVLYPWRVFKGRVTIPGLDRESEFDSYDPVTLELEDYKTAGDYRWDQLGDFGPAQSVWEQVMLYAYALIHAGLAVKTVRLSYIKRCNGHDEVFVRDYDEQVAKAALDRLLGHATRLDLVKDAIDSDADPETIESLSLERTHSGPTNDAMCRRCFARIHCWNMNAAEALGRSPESYTALGADPDDEVVEWAIREKLEAREQVNAAEERDEQAKTMLKGVPPGRYGSHQGSEQGGGGGADWKARAEQLEQYYTLPETERPPLEALPVPTKRRYTFIRWGRVRKSQLEKERRQASLHVVKDGEAS